MPRVNAPNPIKLSFDCYLSEHGTPVIHIDTLPISPVNSQGPILRVYVNDECVFENPTFEEEFSDDS